MNEELSNYQIYSEPFPEMGSISGEGATKLLGQALTPLELLLRETIQNSWDASEGESSQTRFEIKLRFLKNNEKSTLKNFLFELPPSNSKDRSILEEFLNKDNQLIMEICDFGTKGLGGPLSAAKSLNKNESIDFVNFVKNIGSHRDKINGAGTYGFGKSSLFKFSKCNTILIDSLTKYNEKLENRFIGYSLGSEYSSNGQKFTGRHWWGLKKNINQNNFSLDPVLDIEAQKIALNLGLTIRRAEEDKGTSLVILDPDLDDIKEPEFTPDKIPYLRNILKLRIEEILLWWAWPKFTLREDNTYPIKCSISIFDEEYEISEPMNIEPLNLMVKALYTARAKKNPIYCAKPKKLLGYIGEVQDKKNSLVSDSRFRDALGGKGLIPRELSHFALLRPAELVVKYEHVKDALKEDQPQWGGVFICDDNEEIEKAFAKSEPPAHDDWKPNATNEISKEQKTFVISALRNIKKRVNSLNGREKSENDLSQNFETSGDSLAWLSNELAQSIIGKGIIGGTDGLRTQSRRRTARKKNKLKLSNPKNRCTKIDNGVKIAEFVMNLSGKDGTKIEIELNPFVVTEEGNELVAPNGKSPQIIMFEAEDHYSNNDFRRDFSNHNSSEKINPSFTLEKESIEIVVSVEIPDEVAVSLTAELIRN